MMRISQLARAGDVGVETVRFYQRKGLLEVPRGGAPAGRHYDEQDVRRLRYIRQAQTAGFTLAEIGELIELDRTDDRPRARVMARERLAALDTEIARLEEARRVAREAGERLCKGRSGAVPDPRSVRLELQLEIAALEVG